MVKVKLFTITQVREKLVQKAESPANLNYLKTSKWPSAFASYSLVAYLITMITTTLLHIFLH